MTVNLLGRAKHDGDFCRPFFHKVHNFDLHFGKTFFSPFTHPAENDVLHFAVCQPVPDSMCESFEFAYDPKEKHSSTTKGIFLVLQAVPSQISFSHIVQERIEAVELKYTFLDLLLLLTKSLCLFLLVVFCNKSFDQAVSFVLLLLLALLQTIMQFGFW